MTRYLCLVACALLAGCGNVGNVTYSGSTTNVTGKVTSRNGLPLNLQGITVTCPESGGTSATAADGSFALDVPAGAPFRVAFDDPSAFGLLRAGCREAADPDRDANDLLDDGVAIDAIDAGEPCDLEVAIVDGVVVAYRLRRGDPAAEERIGEGWLFPMLPDAAGLLGEIEVTQEGDCWALEVEVDVPSDVSDPSGTYTLELVRADGTTLALGTVTVTAGEGHVRIEACPGDATEVTKDDLAGAVLRVVDAGGAVVLSGVVPDLECEEGWEYPGGDLPDGGGTPPGGWTPPDDWSDWLPDGTWSGDPPGDLGDLLDSLPFDLPAGFPFGR